ncbi:MAG: hypothetical protein U9R03_04475 [Candidatus Aerophobetes bacterium]|nr:hypothetical protein [Candidatus Aerophobetes bacterium]
MIYTKNGERYTTNQLSRMRVTNPEKYGFVQLIDNKPIYDKLTHKIKANSIVNNAIKYDIILLEEDEKILIKKEINNKVKSKIRDSYNRVITRDVTINDIKYNGGFDSAIKIKSVLDLAEVQGLTELIIFDADNNAHNLTIEETKNLVIEIAVDFQNKLAIKQDLFKKITEASTMTELSKIDVPDEWKNTEDYDNQTIL